VRLGDLRSGRGEQDTLGREPILGEPRDDRSVDAQSRREETDSPDSSIAGSDPSLLLDAIDDALPRLCNEA